MGRYDAYGFKTTDLEATAARVSRIIGVELKLRDSSYEGLYYCGGKERLDDFMLVLNGRPVSVLSLRDTRSERPRHMNGATGRRTDDAPDESPDIRTKTARRTWQRGWPGS